MKRISITSIATILLLLTACEQERYPATLTTADSLITVNADSARRVLAGMGGDSTTMTKSHQAYYNLLRLKADITSSVRQNSTAKALETLRYYETGGDRRMLPQAYCCVAGTYRDLNDAPQALDYYKKALDAMLGDGDTRLKGYINNQIGDLFLRQGMHGKAYEYYRHAFQTDSARKDTSATIKALVNMATASENTDTEKSLGLIQQARLLNEKADKEISTLIDKRLSVLFFNKGEYDSAWTHIQKPLRHIAPNDSCAIFSIASDIYLHKGFADSAKYFSLELMRMADVYGKKQASKTLAQIYLGEYNQVLGRKYVELYMAYVDSTEKIDTKAALANANSLYDYHAREKEIARMRMDKKTVIVALLCVFIIAGFVTSLLLFYNLKNKKRQQVLKLRIGLLNKLEEERRKQSESEMSTKAQEIESLTKELNYVKNSKTDLEKQLKEQKERFTAAVENSKSNQFAQDERRRLMLKSKAYSIARARLTANKPISQSEWAVIMDDLNGTLGDFRLLLYQAYDLSEQEYKISLLVKMGFKNVEIGILICRGENTISQTRKRLFTKITGKDGSASDFDELIKSL